mgnify:FL=1
MTAGRFRRQGRMTHQNPSGAADTLRFLPPDGDPLGFFGFSGMRHTGAGEVFRTSPSSARASSAPSASGDVMPSSGPRNVSVMSRLASAIGPSASITSAPFSRALQAMSSDGVISGRRATENDLPDEELCVPLVELCPVVLTL